ncbi:reverse transcriptase, partial [Hamiltosporidium tvaerminnensis]
MCRKENVSSETPKNNKIKAVNDAYKVNKCKSGIKKCDLDPQAISPPSSSYTTITHPPSSQTCKIPSYDMKLLLMAFRTIFDSITADPKEWPRILHRYYDEKFCCSEILEVLKKLAQSEMGKDVKSEENGERRIIATCLTDPYKFFSKIKQILEKEIGKVVVRTRKHPNELVDSKVLDLINRVVGEHAKARVPESITVTAYIMQAAQVCYDEATRKEKPRSSWKENIESKISKLKTIREFNLNLSSVTDLSEALVKKNESVNVYEKKITMHEMNRKFELFRGRFYQWLSVRVESEQVVSRDEIVSFWSTMWNKIYNTVTYDDYLIPFVSDNHPTTFTLLDEFVHIINWLPNWKAAGIDGIYNFFIKKLTTLHKYIYDIFYCGLTHLILKGIPRRGSDYRPITCMSNLYKLTTKVVTKVVQLEVERRGLISKNQLGAVRGVRGAKEQALLNIALNKEYGNNLKATWIDVKKAYDSIDHAYLTQCIENLNLPDWILKFIKKIDRGILQGDSLSPLLFVLCMDPLSRNLNEKYTKVTVQTDAESHSTNHLLFIDDLKLLAKDSSTLSAMTGEAKEFLEVIGLEINKE